MKIEGKTVLITGSTGFLGSRLINRLIQIKNTRVRGLVIPAQSVAKQFVGLPVKKVYGDITSIEDMRRATKGCDIVVHCAVGTPHVTVTGTSNVLKAAAEYKVKKFVHISSTAVFGYSPQVQEVRDGRLPDSYSQENYLTHYSYSKIASEKIAYSYYNSNKVPVVILRPSHIYGPYSQHWTTGPIEMLRQGCYVLVNGGHSPSNAVFVDDVVDAIELAIKEDQAIGHALTISSNQPYSWKEFFSSYAEMISTQPTLLNINLEDLKIERARRHCQLLKKLISNPRQIHHLLPLLAAHSSLVSRFISIIANANVNNNVTVLESALPKNLNLSAIEGIKDLTLMRSKIPEIWLEKTFTLPLQFPINGAADVLGFKPRVSFEEGMKKTEKWARKSMGIISTNSFNTCIIPGLTVSQIPETKVFTWC